MTTERRWAESLFEMDVEGVTLWEPDGRPLYDLTLDEIAMYERSLTGVAWFRCSPHTARLTRATFARMWAGMYYPLRGPALDRPEGTYR